MFLDEAKINIKAGEGGNGMVAFFKLKGGRKKIPTGGSGGKGGSVIIRAYKNLSTLYSFKKKIHFKAESGKSGGPNNRKGEDAKDLIIRVPVGTVVKSSKGEIIADLKEAGDEVVVAEGGIGGRGNAAFVSSGRRFPAFAESGEKTEDFWIELELRLVADVSLVGFPNAGKSTIISRISAARPKIADYPFTTLTPNLGVVTVDDEDFIVADVPGLVEGAHSGKGLGDKFLRHITRSTILVVVLDGQRIIDESEDIIKTFDILREEIRLYNMDLYKKDYIIVINKIDLIHDKDKLNKIKKELERRSGKSVVPVSAVTGEGLDEMVRCMHEKLSEYRKEASSIEETDSGEPEKVKIYRLSDKEREWEKFEVEKMNDEYIVKNKKLERLVAMTDLENEEALDYLMGRLNKMGVADRLKKMGVEEGSTVIIGGFAFVLKE
ncbi:MAG: GTPase ObgE [Actinomycetota bacterium]|nr:GTPase ObgE [Actinomycetota bacterium]